MMDVHSVDAASTTVDCRIHFFWQKFGKKVDVRTSTKSGFRIHYSEKSGCSIHIFNSDVHDIHSVDVAPAPGLTDVHTRTAPNTSFAGWCHIASVINLDYTLLDEVGNVPVSNWVASRPKLQNKQSELKPTGKISNYYMLWNCSDPRQSKEVQVGI